MERECDLCRQLNICYHLPCSTGYFPKIMDLEEPIIDHCVMQYICGKCIFQLDRCPFCLNKFLIRYKISSTRYCFNSLITVLFGLTLLLSIGMSYMGLINTFESKWYERIGFGIDLFFSTGIIMYCISQLDFNINATIIYLWVLSLFNIGYISLFFFDLPIYGNGWVHFALNFIVLQMYFFNQRFCCNSTMCQSPDSILELVIF